MLGTKMSPTLDTRHGDVLKQSPFPSGKYTDWTEPPKCLMIERRLRNCAIRSELVYDLLIVACSKHTNLVTTAAYQSIGLGLDSINAPQFQSQTQTALVPARFVKRHVKAVLCFFRDSEDGSPSHSTYIDRLETLDRPCFTYDMTIDDVCGQEKVHHGRAALPYLQTACYGKDLSRRRDQGLLPFRGEAAPQEFLSILSVIYKPARWLMDVRTGDSRICVCDHTIRCEDPNTAKSTANCGPVQRFHIDQSYSAARLCPRRCF
ncbi:hypothetical protein S40285_10143 [Stachybotrys chlorohalonatus IBT 40285]|uniref:Uncharacterized protein n=1 Tax=Stachybotrys chlorohalonatus (strain IBT 40285) TaxID=1283841 RepID=A0A084QLX0_STAC4|nr:hypothetical protein S40285_10143 [Stachybotrys chlorohalonata IBT 40285]